MQAATGIYAKMVPSRRFPRLEALEELTRAAKGAAVQIERTCVVGVQHLLRSTGSLFESLIALGVEPQNIFILGKHYSSSSRVVEQLKSLGLIVADNSVSTGEQAFSESFSRDVEVQWQQVERYLRARPEIKQIIIIDDGGHCIRSVPHTLLHTFRVAAVEQTTSGIRYSDSLSIPVTNVAACSAKREFESPFIVEAILRRCELFLRGSRATRCGVVGLGAIGNSMARALLQRGLQVWVNDRDTGRMRQFRRQNRATLPALLSAADIIFGCTGEDVCPPALIRTLCGERIFVSCSSEDREFRSLLNLVDRHGVHDDVDATIGDVRVKILNGGFPANFTGAPDSVAPSKIQLTRALLLGGVLQASLFELHPGLWQLNPQIQSFVIRKRSKDLSRLPLSFDPDWIELHSGGNVLPGNAQPAFNRLLANLQ